MHAFLAPLFAFLFSLGHAQAVRQVEARDFVAPAERTAGFDYAIPSRQQILAGETAQDGYAGTGCRGCQQTNTFSPAR